MANLKSGDIVKFTYLSHIGVKPDEPRDSFKSIFVLTPLWNQKMHGIDLKRLTPAERTVLETIMNPNEKGKRHGIPIIDDILARMDPVEEIKNPVSFYSRFVKIFLRDKDAYRTFVPHKMLNVVVAKKSQMEGRQISPTPPMTNKPLFRKI